MNVPKKSTAEDKQVQLPDAVVSDKVPASREEELGAWPERPRLCNPRALLLLPVTAAYAKNIFQKN